MLGQGVVPQKVLVHPLVLLSVVDHYNRMSKDTDKRVVGILLGQRNGSTILVSSSFAVPFEEDEYNSEVWFLDSSYVESMCNIFRKVNAKERLVGWYHTGPKLRSSDLRINELFRKFVQTPVLVIVDLKPKEAGIPTSAYYAALEVLDDYTTTSKTFNHIPSSIEVEETEEIGVEHLLRDIRDTSAGTLSAHITEQKLSLKYLQLRLEDIQSYLSKVVNKTLPINHQILYNLQDIFNLLSNVTDPSTIKAFTNSINDQLLVIYVASLTRAVITMHDLIENKLALRENECMEEWSQSLTQKPQPDDIYVAPSMDTTIEKSS